MIRFVAIQLAFKTTSFILQNKNKTVIKILEKLQSYMRLNDESYLLINGINKTHCGKYTRFKNNHLFDLST